MTSQQDAIQFGRTRIEYGIVRSDRRGSIAVTVHPDGEVSVTAPKRIRRTRIAKAVSAKAEWVIQQQDAQRRRQNGYPRRFISGETFYYLGRQYQLKVERSASQEQPVARFSKGRLLVTLPAVVTPEDRSDVVRSALIAWYRERAESRIIPMVERLSRELGIPFASVAIREMKKRWGSGGTHGRLSFNWRIIMAPRRLIEYVVAHELCHIRHDDHSREFWKLLERAIPNCQERHDQLCCEGAKFDVAISRAD